MVVPRLADVKCGRIKFDIGDRVLVRTRTRLDKEALRKLRRAIEKWAGSGVEVLIYCPLDMEIEIERR